CDRSGTLACNLTITSAEVEFDKSIGVTRAINDLTLTTANLILDDSATIGALATSAATINGTKNIKIGDGNSDGTTFVLNRNDEL
ncbi:hypothetical protein, partial [Klebsiella aerogenes]|uniref:hypothetical protein n=1 Tax=Klebsiella aerogenes TaxID=548 RepID=UPI001CC4ABE6